MFPEVVEIAVEAIDQDLAIENVDAHGGFKELIFGLAPDRFEKLPVELQLVEQRGLLRLFLKARDPVIRPAQHDPELRRRGALHRSGREGDLGTRANVLMKQRPEIHPVKLVPAQDEEIIVRLLEEITQVLADRVGRALIPLRPLGRLLGGEDVDKTAREIIELVARLDVPVKRHAVELR